MRPRPPPVAARRAVIALLAVLLLSATTLTATVPAGAQGAASADRQGQPAVRDPVPPPNAVVQAGQVRIAADLVDAGSGDAGVDDADAVRVVVDGADAGTLGADGAIVDVESGDHLVELTLEGRVLRSWRFHAAAIEVRASGSDPLAVALDASGVGSDDATGPRTVVLANLDRPSLSVALGPLGVAAGAVVLPTAADEVAAEVLDTAVAIAGPDGQVLVLGGLDVVGSAVVAQLRDRGLRVQRIGSGTAAQVAAAAAAHRPALDVYRRGGDPALRPVLVAPAAPLAQAVQAAGIAARYGASLVLADDVGGEDAGAPIDPATAEVIGSRRTVWLDESLSSTAAGAARAAADPAATVTTRPAEPAPAKQVWIGDIAADPTTALLATRAGGTGAAVLVDPVRAAAWVADHSPAGATTVGPVTPQTVAGWLVDGPQAPAVRAELDGTTLRLSADRPVDGTDVHVTLAGREWPGRTTVEGHEVIWTAGPRPQLADEVEAETPTTVGVEVTAVVAAGGHLRHVHHLDRTTIQPLTATSPEGFVVAGGSSAVVGTGPLRTFTIEVEPGTGLDLQAVAAEAEGILLDHAHGWTARGQRSMQRVGDPAAASIRVVVASPATVDRFCGRVGLDTGGRLSCWDGRRAMLNLTRWNTGVAPFHTDLEVYRRYLVSHEVGHGLGYGHVGCPAAGALAPVMMQQSKGLGGCVANGWPYP